MSFLPGVTRERQSEILGVLLLAFTTVVFLALLTDDLRGDWRRPMESLGDVGNALGKPGAWLAGVLILLLGHASHILYCVTAVWGGMLLQHKPLDRLPTRLLGLVLILVAMAGIIHIDGQHLDEASRPGGILGAFFGELMEPHLGIVGAHVVAVTVAIIGVLLSTEFLFVRCFTFIRNLVVFALEAVHEFNVAARDSMRERAERRETLRNAEATAQETPAPKRGRKAVPAEVPADPEPAMTARERSAIRIHHDGRVLERNDTSPFDDVPVVVPGTNTKKAAEPEPSWDDAAGDQLEIASTPASRPKISVKDSKPLPRRKVWVEEELPADYQYPKRFTLPSLELLEPAEPAAKVDLRAELEETSATLEETLNTFGVEARVTDVTRGPSITRFELEPAPGVKVNRFLALADDLALALKAHRVRIEAPIPGKGRVGIEVPNQDRESVVLRELLESDECKRGKGVLNLALGKDITGDSAVADLATMPHLLVAGATGAGKTVCVKSMLASLLFTKTPEEMQLMLIDPKMVELSIFNDIPHLITPVVIDPKKAAISLNWLIAEMEERYRLFAHLRVRNIEVYNKSVENGEIEMPDGEGDSSGESVNVIRKLPYIVCVIDELADLMIIARAEVEDAIARLAQLARAVGIHLIIATQRPSVDVLTGVIKANFPARISFQVSSRVDSRCILDEIGAERLIGQGDMLYLPAGQSKPMRIQGAFVSDEEMAQLIAYLKSQAPPQYRDEIEKFGKTKDAFEDTDDFEDDLFEDAVRVVVETGQASISMVQRRLRVGYTRAARLIDMMEQKGIVGPHVGSKAREILVDSPPKDEVA